MTGARGFLLTLAIVACRPGAAPPHAALEDACSIPGRSAQPDTVRVGVSGDIDAEYARQPRTRAESLAVAHVYETLIRVTCDDRVVPALADRWVMHDDGRAWSFDLRPDATFSDGTPVTARSVDDAWRDRRYGPSAVQDERAAAVEGVVVESERRITVRFRDVQRDGPRILADPYYAIHRRVTAAGPVVGSGRYVAVQPTASTNDSATRTTMTLVPRVPATNPVLSLTASRTGDARDLIDAGVDVMVSADPRILEYAATRPELRLTPLPADRTYLLLTTARSVTGASVRASADDPRFDDLRGSFARDVIRGPAASGSWWGSADRVVACAAPPPPVEARFPSRTASGGGRRIVYPSSDRLAGDIARRLVAIAAQERESFLRARLSGVLPELVTGNPLLVAAGLADGDLSASLMRGDDAAYVLPAPSRALDRCVAWRALRARAPWIDSGVPVVLGEAGASLIAGPNAPAITIDGSNALRIGSSVRAPGNQR